MVKREKHSSMVKSIRREDCAMDAELDAIVEFGNKMGIDSLVQYQLVRDHQEELTATQIEASVQLLFKALYRKEMCGVLDSLITEYMENMKSCIDQIKTLADCPRPRVLKSKVETVKAKVCTLFPPACLSN